MAFHGALGGLAQVRLELGEGHLDWVEVRAVGREEEEFGAGRFDPVADLLSLVAGQVVHDDDVARSQLGDQHPLDMGLEGQAVDRSVEHEGAIMPSSVSPATKVEVFQWPGTCRR